LFRRLDQDRMIEHAGTTFIHKYPEQIHRTTDTLHIDGQDEWATRNGGQRMERKTW
jgi:hypothetical protein